MCRLHKCDSQYCVPLGWDKEVTNTNKSTSWAPKQNLEAPHKQDEHTQTKYQQSQLFVCDQRHVTLSAAEHCQ